MLKRYFVKQGIKETQIERFIKSNFPSGDYSDIVLQRTPLGLKILIYTNKPGRIIGRGGENINMMTDALRERFKLENPQIDIKAIENPDLDAKIVAKQIASALEKGYNYKKIGNLTLRRIMNAGALGTQIVIAGKLGGAKGRTAKFTEGYMKHCGEPAKKLVDHGYEEANTRPGKIGIKVKIMKEFMDITGEMKGKAEMLARSMPKPGAPPEEPGKEPGTEKTEGMEKPPEENAPAEAGKPAGEEAKPEKPGKRGKAKPKKEKPGAKEKTEKKAPAKKGGGPAGKPVQKTEKKAQAKI